MANYPLPIVHREDRQRFVHELKQTHGNNVAFKIVRKDRSIGWAAISWQAIAGEDGDFTACGQASASYRARSCRGRSERLAAGSSKRRGCLQARRRS